MGAVARRSHHNNCSHAPHPLRVLAPAGDTSENEVRLRMVEFQSALREVAGLLPVHPDRSEVFLVGHIRDVAITNVRHVQDVSVVGDRGECRHRICRRPADHLVKQRV